MSAAFTDNEIKIHGIEALVKSLGEVQAERFISLNQLKHKFKAQS